MFENSSVSGSLVFFGVEGVVYYRLAESEVLGNYHQGPGYDLLEACLVLHSVMP